MILPCADGPFCHVRGDFATLCFGEGAVGALHVVQQFADGATAVQDGVLTHAVPVDLIAAVEKHFAQCILEVPVKLLV